MKITYLLVSLLSITLMGCSSDDSTPASNEVVNPMTSSFGTLSTKLEQLDFVKSASASGISATSVDFDDKWDVDLLWPDQACSEDSCDMVTTRDYMGNEIDADATRDNGSDISVVGRVKGAMKIMCAIGVGLGNASGYPDNTGAEGQEFTFTPAVKSQMVSQCDFDDAAEIEDGTTMTIVIEDAENTTNYDKKATIDLANLSGGEQIYYFKATSTAINVATAENYTHESVERASRTVVFYDVENDILKGEYVSGPASGDLNDNVDVYASFYRLYYDADEDNGYILSTRGKDGNDDLGIEEYKPTSFVLAGKPNTTGGKFSLSLESVDNLGAGIFEACVNASDGSIDSDGLCSASATSLVGMDVSSDPELDWLNDHIGENYNGALFATVSADTALNFSNETDVFTADPSSE